MTFTPAHKHIGDVGKPGQLVSSPLAPETPRDERFLSEYIARKTDDFNYFPKQPHPIVKLTFEEWFNQRYTEVDDHNFIHDAREIWHAALRNAPGAK